MNNSKDLRAVGLYLYGPRWQSDLARDLRVSRKTVQRWVKGDYEPAYDLTADLRRLIHAHIARGRKIDQSFKDR